MKYEENSQVLERYRLCKSNVERLDLYIRTAPLNVSLYKVIIKIMYGRWKCFLAKIRQIHNILSDLNMVIEDSEVNRIESFIMNSLEHKQRGIEIEEMYSLYISRMSIMLVVRFWHNNEVNAIDVMIFLKDNSDRDIDLKCVMEDEIKRNMEDDIIEYNRKENNKIIMPTEIKMNIFDGEVYTAIDLGIEDILQNA
jgi:hypothetical protein